MTVSSPTQGAARRGLLYLFAAAFVCASCAAFALIGPVQVLPASAPPTATGTPAPTATATRVPGSPAPVSYSVLVLFVGYASGTPELDGAWVIRWLPEAHDTYVFAAPYDLWVNLGGTPGRLSDAYARAGAGGGLQLIRDAMGREVAGESLDDVVVIDEQCLNDLNLRLGGLSVQGVAPGGSPWAAVRRGAHSVETLERQQNLMNALVAGLRASKSNEIALAWYDMLQARGHTNMAYARFEELVSVLAASPREQELFFAPVNVYEEFLAPDGLPATRRSAGSP